MHKYCRPAVILLAVSCLPTLSDLRAFVISSVSNGAVVCFVNKTLRVCNCLRKFLLMLICRSEPLSELASMGRYDDVHLCALSAPSLS